MIRRCVLAAETAASVMACPARGEDQAGLPQTGVIASENGYRRAETSNGFELVEHGIWKRPEPEALGAGAAMATEVSDQGYRLSDRSIPSNFRRAAYLPHIYTAEAKYALPVGLLDALVWTESRYNPWAVGKAGAARLWASLCREPPASWA